MRRRDPVLGSGGLYVSKNNWIPGVLGHWSMEFVRLGYVPEAALDPELAFFSAFFKAHEPKTDVSAYVYGVHTDAMIRILDEAVKDVEQGISRYLAICVPARHGKSDCGSRRAPAWALLRRPERSAIIASAGDDLAREFSGDCRSVFREAGARLGRYIGDVDQRGNWQTSAGGKVFAVGRGGAPHGHGAHYLFYDDPFRNAEEAESTPIRDKAWTSFRRDLMTRLAPAHLVCILGNRWHERDIVGRIQAINKQGGPDFDPRFPEFDILEFPAWIDEDNPKTGQKRGWLFPERFPESWYEMHRSANSEITGGSESAWLAQFQQNPRPRRGKLLKIGLAIEQGRVHWITDDDQWPSGLRWRRGWDLASTEEERTGVNPDFTVGTLAAYQPGKLYLRNVQRGRWEATRRNEIMRMTGINDGPDVKIRAEVVAGYKDAYTLTRDALRGVRSVEAWHPNKGTKFDRATTLESVFESGEIWIRRADWNDEWIEEIGSFPTSGKKDDQVDSLVVAVHADIVKPAGSMSFSM